MGLESEVTSVEQVNFGVRQVTQIGSRSRRYKGRVIFPPGSEKRRLSLAEIILECWIEFNIAAIIQHQIELDFV
jgi:hypothetical protein